MVIITMLVKYNNELQNNNENYDIRLSQDTI
jgi:hypothetical protein